MHGILPDNRQYRFSGHQTFAFRFGWLEKGVRGVRESSTIFSDDDALVRLGVGKNMVQSIRHWCVLTQLIETDASACGKRGCALRVSDIGSRLLLDGGWDPFLEDDASLWLIHWLLVTNPEIGTTWQVLYSLYHRPDFTRRELVDYMKAFAERRSLRTSEASLARDVDCFLRTYVPAKGSPDHPLAEETFDCPLLSLRLIQPSPDGELYAFSIGPKPSLPGLVVGFAISEYFTRLRTSQSTMSISQCLYGPESPGQAFKLDESSLMEYVEVLEDITNGALALDETAGLKTIYRRREVDGLGLLARHFGMGAR